MKWGHISVSDFITGTGQTIVNVHAESEDCRTYGCVIHNPTPGPMSSFPTHWRTDRNIMERICPHGIGHPDHDSVNFWYRTKGEDAKWDTVHGCDGCCSIQICRECGGFTYKCKLYGHIKLRGEND